MNDIPENDSAVPSVIDLMAPPDLLPADPFPIVGFGGSAGGIKAFIELIEQLDNHLGMAYILVIHLSPRHKSALAEVIQTHTTMPVYTVTDGMEIAPDHIYVIPPNTMMNIFDGHLKLAPRSLPPISNFGVDFFLEGLAAVYKNNAIGVILSGSASDGTLGLKAIKAEGGITFAQDDTAEFSDMPSHAFDAGYVDYRLSPKGIALELERLAKVPYSREPLESVAEQPVDDITLHREALKKILSVIKRKTGVDFYTDYKQASIYRRIMRRMVLTKCVDPNEYLLFLQTHEEEVFALYNDFLINVTHFFRDPQFYLTLTNAVFPALVSEKSGTSIRIWVAGCSTGEEAFSIAICLTEFLNTKGLEIPIKIFASDLDQGAIEKARTGVFPLSAMHAVPEPYLSRYFHKLDGHYQIIKTVRECCIFSEHNLMADPPFSNMDLISCQNVLIYMETGPQRKILQTFHYAMKPTGYMFLGKSESVGQAVDLFKQADRKLTLYTKKLAHLPQQPFNIQSRDSGMPSLPKLSLAEEVEQEMGKLVLSNYVRPCMVVDKAYRILHFFGQVAPFLQPTTGKASLNILKMVREELVVDLGRLLLESRKTDKIAIQSDIVMPYNQATSRITLEVVPKKRAEESYFLVVFCHEEASGMPTSSDQVRVKRTTSPKEKIIQRLEAELVQSRQLIRTTHEEYESTYEELQANSEEILSSNEELKSVNEELETSKEELQSSNEELTYMNKELEVRNIELDHSQKELQKANGLLTEFAFIASHDLQEPLRKIEIFSDMLTAHESHLNEYAEKYAVKINAAAARMSSLVKDLLTFSVLIKSDSRVTAQVDLNETMKNVLEDFELIIDAKKAVLHVDPLPVVVAEPVQMNHLFQNLVGNALKFAAKPDIHITSSVLTVAEVKHFPELVSGTRYVSICVQDNGIGFNQKYVPLIFSLFQRLNKSEKDSTGVGLAISKKIVEDHGGIILASSEDNSGALFTVVLPVDGPSPQVKR